MMFFDGKENMRQVLTKRVEVGDPFNAEALAVQLALKDAIRQLQGRALHYN